MQPTKNSIFGCGWLGLPLAEALLKKHFIVRGSTTTQNKLPILRQAGIDPFLISLTANNISGNVTQFLQGSTILIINIPPKLRNTVEENFISKIQILIPFIENSTVEFVLFVSSTSVYADDNSNVTEETVPNPDNEGGRQLLIAEELLRNNPNFKTTILRFAGLMGGERHPVRYLSGKEDLLNRNAPINLIHRDDCISIILKIIEMAKWDETFNASAPFHPSRKKYYTEKALKLNIAVPSFRNHNDSFGKVIDSSKLIRDLNYDFLYPRL